MAMADYKACDLCGAKAFYDADVTDRRYVATWDPGVAEGWDPVGIAVLCPDCNKTHEAIILPRLIADVKE